MWDYDKLFAVGNVICVGDIVSSVDEFNIMDWKDSYANKELTHKALPNGKIQYIIRLDGHGNVVEKLFDRERDMVEPMPKLETGMFVKIKYGEQPPQLGYVDVQNKRIIYQNGRYDFLSILERSYPYVLALYDKNAYSFNGCDDNAIIWKNPKFQT